MNVIETLRSGRVRRWHANPDMADTDETNAQHQWSVAILVLGLHPSPSPALVRAALTHDVGEVGVGDLPYPVKVLEPDLAAAHAALEAEMRSMVCGDVYLSEDERTWLNFADRLAGWLWMMQTRPQLAGHLDWRDMAADLTGMAWSLGIGHLIDELIEGRGP